MKKSSIITIALIVCLILLAAGSFSVFGFSIGGYANAEMYQAGDTTITSAVENLEIDWTAGSVNIVFHTGSEIKVSETSKKALSDDTRLHWWLDGTTLRIRFAKSGFRLFNNLEKALTVSLPEGLVLDNATIRATSADLNISALAAKNMILETTSGDMDALLAAKKLKASSTSGSLDIRQRGGSNSVTVGATSGNIVLSVEDAKEISASSTSGGITFTQKGDADSVSLHTTSGDITAENVRAGKAEVSSTSGTIRLQLNTLNTLTVSSTSGDVTASLPALPGFTARISTTSGSFDSGISLLKDGKTYTCGDGSGSVKIDTTSGSVHLLENK